jgi:ankyrin repeat protein
MMQDQVSAVGQDLYVKLATAIQKNNLDGEIDGFSVLIELATHEVLGVTDGDGRTLLHIAAAAGNLDALKGLCERKKKFASPSYVNAKGSHSQLVAWANHPDGQGTAALTLATDYGHTKTVSVLLAVPGIDVNHASQYGHTALISASKGCHIEVIHALLKVDDIEINHADSDGNTALIMAVDMGHAEIVQVLLAASGIDVNIVNSCGYSALIAAASEGHTEIVQALLKAGAHVNCVEDGDGSTALISAAIEDHTEIVQALLAAGANMPIKAVTVTVAEILAIKEAHEEMPWFSVRAPQAWVEALSMPKKACEGRSVAIDCVLRPASKAYGNGENAENDTYKQLFAINGMHVQKPLHRMLNAFCFRLLVVSERLGKSSGENSPLPRLPGELWFMVAGMCVFAHCQLDDGATKLVEARPLLRLLAGQKENGAANEGQVDQQAVSSPSTATP